MPCLLWAERVWYLLMAHAFTDYVWQPEHMGQYKHPGALIPLSMGPWWWHMTAHGLINAAGVTAVTGSTWLGVAEFACHIALDYAKCQGVIGAGVDQLGHLLCKGVWATCLSLHLS